MKTFHYIYKTVSLVLGLSFLMTLPLRGQPVLRELTSPVLPAESGEKIRLFTDRSIYCVNEEICFTAAYSCIGEFKAITWSTVLYVELIRWNGARIAGMKLKLEDEVVSASIGIPGNLPSGNYYLRAYTRWMRNYSPDEYACIGVRIVNPYRPETDDGPDRNEAVPGGRSMSFIQRNLSDGIAVVMDKKEYSRGERAEIMVGIDGRQLSGESRFYLTVARAGTVDTTDRYTEPSPLSAGDRPSYPEYLPEIRGITVSGTVSDRSEGLPLKNVPVSLSETESGEFFATCTTDERGKFVFSLPDMSKQHDFFVQTETPSVIRIDNDYCNRPVRLPFIAFALSRAETDYVREVMISQQLAGRFHQEKGMVEDTAGLKTGPTVFYGSRKTVYYTDKYIELPDIKEFIFEIVLEAGIVNDKDKNSVISMRRAVSGYFPPLVMLDNVRIDGNEQFLKIPLNRIERIEVINTDYLAGNERYYGIMSFYSKNKDFAGMDLNRNSQFFSYDLFTEIPPDSDPGGGPGDHRIPDLRNQLYWNPDLRLPASGPAVLSFTTSDRTGEYVVFVRSKNQYDQGGICGMCRFTVR